MIGFLCGGLSLGFPVFEKAFFESKITDYASVIVTLVVGVFATFFINKSIEKSSHNISVVERIVTSIESELETLYKNVNAFINSKNEATPPTESEKTNILFLFKRISSLLTVLEGTHPCKDNVNLRDSYQNFKIATTDENFTVNSTRYEKEQLLLIENSFLIFSTNLLRTRAAAYS